MDTKATFLIYLGRDIDWSVFLFSVPVILNGIVLGCEVAWKSDVIWTVFVFQLYQGGKISAVDRLELDQICSEHIASSVDLRWHILSSGTRGRVSLKGITVTPEMLDLVRMSPLQWGMYCSFYIIVIILQKNNKGIHSSKKH